MTIDTADEIESDFLFARPSLAEGVGRILDFSNVLSTYNTSADGDTADARALERDWHALAHDLRVALRLVRSELESTRG